tara:strand:- start:7598 stop:8881 length:1284 start_codon:yes stop_codon:yes gene_type:complete
MKDNERQCLALEDLLESYYDRARAILETCEYSDPEPVDPEPVEPDPDPIEPEPVDPPSYDFMALRCARNTVEQNKVVALPAMRANRQPRTLLGAIGDVKRGDWTQGNLLKEDMESVVPKGYTQWSSNLHKDLAKRPGVYTWKNIGVSPVLMPELARQLKWGTREYNTPMREFLQCDFTDIPREHGLYVSNYEGTKVEECTFLRCGSQGVQFAHRELPYQQYGADNLPYETKPYHVLRDTHFVDNAYKGDRPSFNATYFDPGSSKFPGTLLVQNCSFVADWDVARSDGKKSTGAFVISHMQGNPDLKDQNMMELVHFKNCLLDFTKGDRSLMAIRSTDELLMEDCCFIAREHTQPYITIDKDYGNMGNTKTKVIRVRNCIALGGVKVNVLLATKDGKQVSKKVDIHCPGGEIVIDGITGEIIRSELAR